MPPWWPQEGRNGGDGEKIEWKFLVALTWTVTWCRVYFVFTYIYSLLFLQLKKATMMFFRHESGRCCTLPFFITFFILDIVTLYHFYTVFCCRYVDHLANSLKQKLELADKMVASQKAVQQKRKDAQDEVSSLQPKLKLIIARTKELQGEVCYLFLLIYLYYPGFKWVWFREQEIWATL